MFDHVTHSHEDGEPFRPADLYLLASSCPICLAHPDRACRMGPTVVRGRVAHLKRQDRGRRWQLRDHEAAPWPEDRVPGVCYSTLPGCQPS